MLNPPLLNQTQPCNLSKTHLLLLQISDSPHEFKQIHALTIKTGSFHHISISSCLLSLSSNPKLGALQYARSLFDQISVPNSLAWNSIIKCYVENEYSEEGFLLFCKLLRESNISPDNFTYPSVIKGCSRLRGIKEGKQIHGLVVKTGFGGDVYVQSSLVSLYAKCGKMETAQEVFDRMCYRDLISWNCLIDGYAKCGEIEIARQMFDLMPERDLFSWTALIDGYSKCGKVEVARQVFDRMPERNLFSLNAMIDGYMKNKQFEMARRLFDEMQNKSTVTWNIMISGYTFNGKFQDALSVFQAMLEEDVKVNYATLVGTLSAVSGLGFLENGRRIHSYMVRGGFKFDGVLGVSLIDMYSKCGSIESALTIFQAISKKRVGHWTAVIMGLGMHGMPRKALELFEEMQRIGLKPHEITFIGVLNACSHAGMVEEGRYYFKLMTDSYGITPRIEHYGCLVDLLCRAGHLEAAKHFIDMMPIRPNEIIWMSLLSGCRKHGNVEIGEYAAVQVIELAPNDTGCYTLLCNIYAAATRWDQVSKLRELMKVEGLTKKDPGKSSIEHRGIVHDFVLGDKSHPQTTHIYSKMIEMGKRLRSAGYIPDTTQVLLCVEEKEKEVELAHHSERLAIAFGLINIDCKSPIRVVKNLRVCNDCHLVTKLLSSIYDRQIIVRDNSRFHHFKNGLCSCRDYW